MKISRTQPSAAFTLIEIAISLAVISFALVAIIGVLPRGLRVQRENREETIINQDASVFLSAIRNGTRGLDDLTNYVQAITNYWTVWEGNSVINSGTDGYTWVNSDVQSVATQPLLRLTNGFRIVGLLGRPKYDQVVPPAPNQFQSNFVVAFVRAISGPASEKPPQGNAEVQADAFSYQMISENLPVATYDGNTAYGRGLTNNLHEMRLTFRWPLSATGKPGLGRQTFRTQVGGQLTRTNDPYATDQPLFFFAPQTFAQPPS